MNIIAMIFTAIIEDDREIRAAIRDYLHAQPNMACEIDVDSIEDFLAVLNDETAPDVILMDIGLPGISGISGIKLIKERYPEIDVIMFTIYEDPHKIFQSLCAGASAYLLKNSQFEEIKRTIEIVRSHIKNIYQELHVHTKADVIRKSLREEI